MNILITGGAGFIGSNFVRHLLARDDGVRVVNLDLLTYAGSMSNLREITEHERHTFVEGDICDSVLLERMFREFHFDTVVHFAAESSVDRSIIGPDVFVRTNIVGTFNLLEAARKAWSEHYNDHRFLFVSTDEVYGTLEPTAPGFTETTPFAPTSPYSASKAAAHHLANAYFKTYGFPAFATCCSNNYGPRQSPEKLIPLIIVNALTGKRLPIYGDGQQVRDWLYVDDHCRAITAVLEQGRIGETYNVGGKSEKTNIDVVRTICGILDELMPRADALSYREQITHVTDRLGHDRRYAINADKLQSQLGWSPSESFETGLRKTVEWYLANRAWVNTIMSENCDQWVEVHYADREEI